MIIKPDLIKYGTGVISTPISSNPMSPVGMKDNVEKGSPLFNSKDYSSKSPEVTNFLSKLSSVPADIFSDPAFSGVLNDNAVLNGVIATIDNMAGFNRGLPPKISPNQALWLANIVKRNLIPVGVPKTTMPPSKFASKYGNDSYLEGTTGTNRVPPASNLGELSSKGGTPTTEKSDVNQVPNGSNLSLFASTDGSETKEGTGVNNIPEGTNSYEAPKKTDKADYPFSYDKIKNIEVDLQDKWDLSIEPYGAKVPRNPYGTFIPCTNFSLKDRTAKTNTLELFPGMTFTYLEGFTFQLTLTTGFVESIEFSIGNWLETYGKIMVTEDKKVLPYKDACSKLTFYYYCGKDEVVTKIYYGYPLVSLDKTGAESQNSNRIEVDWILVGDEEGDIIPLMGKKE